MGVISTLPAEVVKLWTCASAKLGTVKAAVRNRAACNFIISSNILTKFWGSIPPVPVFVNCRGSWRHVSRLLGKGTGIAHQRNQEFARLFIHGLMGGMFEPDKLLAGGADPCEPVGGKLGIHIIVVQALE